jgi:hypothetical protein
MKKYLLFIFFTGTMAMMVVMSKTGAPLKTDATPMGILNLEFASNSTKTSIVVNAWTNSNHADLKTTAKINTYWDFLFLFFYAGFLFLVCKKIALYINGPVAKAGNLIAKGALLAGFLDVLENTGMLLTLNDQGSSTIAFCTTFFSLIKWVLVLLTLFYILTCMLVLAYRKIK